jgi:hypothetical protein
MIMTQGPAPKLTLKAKAKTKTGKAIHTSKKGKKELNLLKNSVHNNPKIMLKTTVAKAILNETGSPFKIIENKSLPIPSVPSQCTKLGDWNWSRTLEALGSKGVQNQPKTRTINNINNQI